jgi:putative mycofactocin binding protein MftB
VTLIVVNKLGLPSKHIFYCLRQGIRVRKEAFGLLFYDPRGPKLTFVNSGQWIEPDFFSGKTDLKKWLHNQFPALSQEKVVGAEKFLSLALSNLVEKGLIVEAAGRTMK